MRNTGFLSQRAIKRRGAAALQDIKDRCEWSNVDLARELGCSEGNIRNRLKDDDEHNQITIDELLRSIQRDGTHLANAMLSLVGHHAAPDDVADIPDAMEMVGQGVSLVDEVLKAWTDRTIDRGEARKLLPACVHYRTTLCAFETMLRQKIEGE